MHPGAMGWEREGEVRQYHPVLLIDTLCIIQQWHCEWL